MKTYEEMAQAVICRAKKHRAARNRRIITVAVAILCVCGVSLAVYAANKPDSTDEPVIQLQQSTEATPTTEDPPVVEIDPTVEDVPAVPNTARVMFLCAAADGSEAVNMQKDIKMPYRMMLRVKDTRGLTEDEKSALYEEEKNYANEMIDTYVGDSTVDWAWTQFSGENAVITTISAGSIILRLEDTDLVESIHVSVTDMGHMCHIPGPGTLEPDTGPKEYHIDAKQIWQYYSWFCDGVPMIWMLDDLVKHEITIDPTIPLSDLRDTITVTVTFKDGTVETHQIDIVIDDSGEIYTIYRGQPTAV